MDVQLIDALRVVGLEIRRDPYNPRDDEWFCTSPLGRLGPYRSEEWALVEGVRALTSYAAGLDGASGQEPGPFERYLRDLERERGADR